MFFDVLFAAGLIRPDIAAPVISGDALVIVLAVKAVMMTVMLGLIFSARREARFARSLASGRADVLNDAMQTVGVVEDIAGLGVWQYDPASGIQQWSKGLRRLFGIDHSDPFVEGDAETLLFANNVDLIGAVMGKLSRTDNYDLHFEIYGFDAVHRSLCIQVCNLRDPDGAVARIVAVVRDITEQKERERVLEGSRVAAELEASRALELAETDVLTGLANRRRVMERLDRLVMDARHDGSPLVLIMFDIDHFKHVNDTYGHLAGDEVLKTIARIAEAQTRDGDIVGRVGGEEFVWVVPGVSEARARDMSERLREAVAAGSGTGVVPAVTMSAGFADLYAGDTSLSLFARADAALYEAKNAGRNQVRMAA
ncbi:sensor domain-containing diguanylate cyclase [Erythrobacter sp.]|nr:sensor domain-containing diguanylate cyclase [Erythrobacter sp.]